MGLEKTERIFLSVLEDIVDYLPDLTLVGGWLPYIYSNFFWKNFIKNPVTTVDVDFGVDGSITGDYSKTIFETLSSLKYKERHLKIGKLFPIVLYKEKIPVEFITYPAADNSIVEKIVGKQIKINKIDKFEFLLKHRISISIQTKKKNKACIINCPKPSAFLYHKGATFVHRENKEKQAKDLYYIYFILRYAPDINMILKEVAQYKKQGYLKRVCYNINKYFERISSEGCILVEQENGPDYYIDDIRQDVFERFNKLIEII